MSELCETFAISIFRFSDVPRNSFTLNHKCVTVAFCYGQPSLRGVSGEVAPTVARKVFGMSSQRLVLQIETVGSHFPIRPAGAHRNVYHAVPLSVKVRPRGKRYGVLPLVRFQKNTTVSHFVCKVEELRGTSENQKMEIANV